MKRIALALLVGAAVTIAPLASPAPSYADSPLWYRGLFDGKVEITDEGPWGLCKYTPSRPSTYPLGERRYSTTSDYWQRGRPSRAAWGQETGEQDQADRGKQDERRDNKVYTLCPLPGQYWFKPQPHFNFRTPITVGWPYLKYDQPY